MSDAVHVATEAERRTVRPVAPTFAIDSIRCAAEVATRSYLESKTDFLKRLQSRSKGREESFVEGRLSLVKNHYRVDPTLSPLLHRLQQMLRATLRIVQPIDLYVREEPSLNAFCMPSRKGTRLVMCLNSGLVNHFTPHELMFVMGHEAGHALLDHGRFPHIEFDDADFSPLEVVRLRALSRRQELSCDRVGYLACQSTAVAGSALLKLISGLSDRWIKFEEDAFLRQFDQMADLVEMTTLDDAASSHPVIGLRAKALRLFASSSTFAEATSQASYELESKQLEQEVEHMLSVLEPDLREIESASEEDAVNQFLRTGAMAITAADGTLDTKELAYLKQRMQLTDQLIGAMQSRGFVNVAMDGLSEEASVLRKKLSLQARCGLLHELCRVALSAGGYAVEEQKTLFCIAELLDIPPEGVRHVLGNAEPPELGEPEAEPAAPVKRRRKAKAEN